ncbi:hypothetical protein [Larkinella sp. C7]|nr:hypothetical protein [Larkinella sp. C7]
MMSKSAARIVSPGARLLNRLPVSGSGMAGVVPQAYVCVRGVHGLLRTVR